MLVNFFVRGASNRNKGSAKMRFGTVYRAALWAITTLLFSNVVMADDYTVAEGNKSMMVALGCFWCAEQAFEQYAPGVVEAVSGYAGGTLENPTYRNHDGHYEVVLVEYDPSKTSYEVLVEYAFRNTDPFDGDGQFCDKGGSYKPAIFYETEEELAIAQDVLGEILEVKGWQLEDIAAPLLERPTFWTAEDYHQDYYLKNPERYGYYKNACGRPKRLKEVWGTEEYDCFHREGYTCLVEGESTLVINADGEIVTAMSNIKQAEEETAALLPPWALLVILLSTVVLIALIVAVMCHKRSQRKVLEK